jgi:hypothetical protein
MEVVLGPEIVLFKVKLLHRIYALFKPLLGR